MASISFHMTDNFNLLKWDLSGANLIPNAQKAATIRLTTKNHYKYNSGLQIVFGLGLRSHTLCYNGGVFLTPAVLMGRSFRPDSGWRVNSLFGFKNWNRLLFLNVFDKCNFGVILVYRRITYILKISLMLKNYKIT